MKEETITIKQLKKLVKDTKIQIKDIEEISKKAILANKYGARIVLVRTHRKRKPKNLTQKIDSLLEYSLIISLVLNSSFASSVIFCKLDMF